jgi:hypothetical protein
MTHESCGVILSTSITSQSAMIALEDWSSSQLHQAFPCFINCPNDGHNQVAPIGGFAGALGWQASSMLTSTSWLWIATW